MIALDPGNSLAHAMLGDLLGASGRCGEATAMLRRATELDPERIGAYHNLTVLTLISDADRPLVEQMTELLAQSGRSDADRSLLNFAPGKAHDDLGIIRGQLLTSRLATASNRLGSHLIEMPLPPASTD